MNAVDQELHQGLSLMDGIEPSLGHHVLPPRTCVQSVESETGIPTWGKGAQA